MKRNSGFFIHGNALENVCETVAILLWERWVNGVGFKSDVKKAYSILFYFFEIPSDILDSIIRFINVIRRIDKQRVLMHRHQGWNVRHGLCHIYMRYLYIYELFIAFVCFVVCSLLQRDGIFGVLCRKWQARESTGMFGNLMAIYYIMPQFIQNHSRFVMLMKTCMIS